MTVKLLTEHHFEFLSLKGGCTGLCESTHIKIPHCWKSCDTAHLLSDLLAQLGRARAVRAHLFLTMPPGQGCRNTMPNLSDLVPFQSGQVENFCLLVLGHVQMY